VRSSRVRRSRRIPFSTFSLVLLLPLLLGSSPRTPLKPSVFPPVPVPSFSDRVTLQYEQAATSLRRNDCAGAAKALTPVMASKGSEAGFARLLSGLYAHACEQVPLAEERLFGAANPDGVLEDWRLYLLSDAAQARGHALLAQASLAKLLGDYPASPLRPRALLKAATLAWERGDSQRALELVEQKRREDLQGEDAVALETLAWEIANRLGDPELRRDAARQLLIQAPTVASSVQAA
jgi:hypothetical protein